MGSEAGTCWRQGRDRRRTKGGAGVHRGGDRDRTHRSLGKAAGATCTEREKRLSQRAGGMAEAPVRDAKCREQTRIYPTAGRGIANPAGRKNREPVCGTSAQCTSTERAAGEVEAGLRRGLECRLRVVRSATYRRTTSECVPGGFRIPVEHLHRFD